MNHIIEHCGNFSPQVLEGLIGYGRELDKGRGRINASNDLSKGDGYATKEADIQLGGFIQRRAAQVAHQNGKQLAKLNLQEKQRLAFRISKEHLIEHSTVGKEHYRRWMVRAQSFARHQQIQLPEQKSHERNHQYFRRVRQWVKTRAEKWPELRPGAGTHLVLSPDPVIWKPLRAIGIDERSYLRLILSNTMREFSDWRRKEVGVEHSLGWVAGTHVEANGADRHPHLHLVVLKRDEVGQEVDWSVSALKGCPSRNSPDPLLEIKRLFSKNVERQLERTLGKETLLSLQLAPAPDISKAPPLRALDRPKIPKINLYRLRQFARGLKAVFRAMQPYRNLKPGLAVECTPGTLIRQIAMIQERSRMAPSKLEPGMSLPEICNRVRTLLRQKDRAVSMPSLER